MTSNHRLGFDIGGTFTDFVLVDGSTGELILGKCLTTPHDPAEGVKTGLMELLPRAGISGSDISIAVHATTLITNALIERRGAKTALLTTNGFRDAIEMGTELRYDNYDLHMQMPVPLVSRHLRFDVRERLNKDGDVLVPLDEEQVREIAHSLVQQNVEAVAIVYLHAFRNRTHEVRTAEILAEEAPGILVSLSSTVSPEIREFERSSTTVANAYVQPIVRDYLDKASATLSGQGYERALHLMISSGGVSSANTIKELPIRMLESGPTAGVLAAIHYGRLMNMPNLVTFDMGGTTAKIGLVKNHEAKKSTSFEVGRVARFMKGSGLPIRIPLIELIEIGAGGGSIAHVDQLGLMAVGPQSASSAPGPACYGRGGENPTVTDANLVLGYLNADNFLGGAMQLDIAASRRAIENKLARVLGMSVEQCAQGIFEIVNQNMLAASKVHIAERGEDPRNFYLFSFGGAGPAHAYELARALQMKGVIVPPGAGAASALGLVVSPVSFDLAQTFVTRLDTADWPDIAAVFRKMAEEGRVVLHEADVRDPSTIAIRHFMDLRHHGQGREISVEIATDVFERGDLVEMSRIFYEAHHERYGHAHEHLPVELITCRTTVSGPAISVPISTAFASDSERDSAAPPSHRRVFFKELGGYADTPVYDRMALTPGMTFRGPAIIEERECTTVVGPSADVRIDSLGSIFIDLLREAGTPRADEARQLADA
jgi:N-methylhydantoinase A